MQLPFSVIKLDRSLLFHICTDKNAALFYQSIVSAFCRLGYRIIAEGVETQEEMELLRSWNVDMIQGYYFSRPLPPGDLLRRTAPKIREKNFSEAGTLLDVLRLIERKRADIALLERRLFT